MARRNCYKEKTTLVAERQNSREYTKLELKYSAYISKLSYCADEVSSLNDFPTL